MTLRMSLSMAERAVSESLDRELLASCCRFRFFTIFIVLFVRLLLVVACRARVLDSLHTS